MLDLEDLEDLEDLVQVYAVVVLAQVYVVVVLAYEKEEEEPSAARRLSQSHRAIIFYSEVSEFSYTRYLPKTERGGVLGVSNHTPLPRREPRRAHPTTKDDYIFFLK